jgi:hypothetical protein
MKAFTTFASAAALAVSIAAVSVPAHAIPFAQFSPVSGNADYKWIQSAAGTGGELISVNSLGDTTAQAVAVHFDFIPPAGAGTGDLFGLKANFTFDAKVADGTPATPGGGGTYTQTDLNSTLGFKFIYSGPTQVIDGFTLTQGVTNLLSGTFTNAWIQGGGSSGSANLAVGIANYTSDIQSFAGIVANSETFAFNLLSATNANNSLLPGFNQSAPTKSLDSFSANGGGNFAFEKNSVPEPATWALMIIGFGGVGALLRGNRRRAIATTA